MNCPQFQDLLFEYLEGSLAPAIRDSADAHLSSCPACRQAVRQQTQIARSFSRGFQQAAQTLALRPDIQRRVLAALQAEPVPLPGQAGVLAWWQRLVWPVAITAALLLATALMTGVPFSSRVSVIPPMRSARRDAPAPTPVSIRLSYCVPTYTFRQNGNTVIDSLTCNPRVVDQTIWLSSK